MFSSLCISFGLGWFDCTYWGSNSLVVCKAAVKINCVLVVLRLWFGGSEYVLKNKF